MSRSERNELPAEAANRGSEKKEIRASWRSGELDNISEKSGNGKSNHGINDGVVSSSGVLNKSAENTSAAGGPPAGPEET